MNSRLPVLNLLAAGVLYSLQLRLVLLKAFVLPLLLQVNRVNARLKQVTQKQMACVAELAMLQAESFQLQQQARMKENMLEQCHIRLEKGEAPTAEMEVEWLQMVHGEQKRLADRESSQVVSSD